MSDRGLLELAAKAAGHKIVEWTKDGNGVEVAIIVRGDGDGFSKRPWQPLHENQWTDTNGDALRLAVKLAIDFKIRNEATWWDRQESEGVVYWSHEPHNGDPLAATRRAITRAAAEIGKEMP